MPVPPHCLAPNPETCRLSLSAPVLDGLRTEDVGKALDEEGIAVRAGHHCAEPLMHRFGLESTARASFGIYTTHEEIDFLADALARVREFFT